jgi:hypothetical protein
MERRAIDNLSRKFRAAKAAQSLDLEQAAGSRRSNGSSALNRHPRRP